MPSYEVFDHEVDHPPIFICRKHKTFLKLNVSFVQELLAWGETSRPQSLVSVGANALDGDERAYAISDYLIPPKMVLFNPRNIRGHGALPFAVVFLDNKFFGIPTSYLRRRIFDGCEECLAENDPSSDHSFPDYQPTTSKRRATDVRKPQPGRIKPTGRPLRREGSRGEKERPSARTRRPAQPRRRPTQSRPGGTVLPPPSGGGE